MKAIGFSLGDEDASEVDHENFMSGVIAKFRRIGHDAMMEQEPVHIGYEADWTAHLLDTNGKKIGVTGLLDTGAVVSMGKNGLL